ncbi:MAG: hypothetical protein ACK5HY_17050 [Parahaliea sp.]
MKAVFSNTLGEPGGYSLGELPDLLARGLLRPRIGARFPLSEFRLALHSCGDRGRIGKTVVDIA